MNIDNAFETLTEEMGATGIAMIKKNLIEVLKGSNLKGKWGFKQKGVIFSLYKNGKKFADIPYSKAMNKEYLESLVKGEV